MKVALVHDHLAQDGGAEKVLKCFQELYPKAPVFVLVYNKDRANKFFHDKDIRTSFIQKIPGGVKNYKWFLPIMPAAVESYDLMDYDVILSSSSSLAKGIVRGPESIHICYCHTPTRFLWSDTHTYVNDLPYHRYIKQMVPIMLNRLRIWDRLAADRVDYFIANSRLVKSRIKKYYRENSDVIYPPVEIDKFKMADQVDDYFLTGGRLVTYKRYDLTVEAFNHLGIPLKIFGEGPDMEKLQKMAHKNIEFLGKISDEQKAEYYSKCRAFINPQVEDFGITCVEAMASGRPVIAFNKGGATETVISGKTGVFFDEQNWESLGDTVIRFKNEDFNPQEIREHAARFNEDRFKNEIKEYVEQKWQDSVRGEQ